MLLFLLLLVGIFHGITFSCDKDSYLNLLFQTKIFFLILILLIINIIALINYFKNENDYFSKLEKFAVILYYIFLFIFLIIGIKSFKEFLTSILLGKKIEDEIVLKMKKESLFINILLPILKFLGSFFSIISVTISIFFSIKNMQNQGFIGNFMHHLTFGYVYKKNKKVNFVLQNKDITR